MFLYQGRIYQSVVDVGRYFFQGRVGAGGGSGGDHSLPSPPAEVPRDIPPPPEEEDEKAQFLRQDAKDNEKKGEDSVEDDGAPSLDSLAARFARLKD